MVTNNKSITEQTVIWLPDWHLISMMFPLTQTSPTDPASWLSARCLWPMARLQLRAPKTASRCHRGRDCLRHRGWMNWTVQILM